MALFSNTKWKMPILVVGMLAFVLTSLGAFSFARPPLDLRELQGRWDFVSCTMNGKPVFQSVTLEVKDDRCTFTKTSQGGKARLVLDVTQQPATMDEIRGEGTGVEVRLPGVFEVSMTRLVICRRAGIGGDRPTSLESTFDNQTLRSEWQRRGPAPPEGSSVSRLLEGDWFNTKNIRNGSEWSLPFRMESTLNVKGNQIVSRESKIFDEYSATLLGVSGKVDLKRVIGNQAAFRALIDYDFQSQELKVAQAPLDDGEYPEGFDPTPENSAMIFVFKKGTSNSP